MTKPRKVTVPRALLVPILRDAAIAGPVAEGRLIPVLILDTSDRKEVSELIRVHAHLQPGNVKSQWATSRVNDDHVLLLLSFTQPMEVELILLFGIEHQAILVETILSGSAVYLQAGVVGDRVISTIDAPRVLVEIPDTGFRAHWDQLLLNRMTVVVSRRLRVSRRKARPAAEAVIGEMGKLARLRMGQ